MRKSRLALAMLVAVLAMTSSVWAACGPMCPRPSSTCTVCPQPQRMKWVTVTETVMQKVPVKRWEEEVVQVPCIKKKPVQVEVPCTVMKPRVEEVTCIQKKQVWETEEYQSYEFRTVKIECEGVKKICRTEPYCATVKVRRKVCSEECDPATGQMKAVTSYVYDDVEVVKNRKVADEVPYTYTKSVKEKVPVTKTRKVCKWVEVPGNKRITRMVPEESTRMITQYKNETVMVNRTIRKCVVDYVDQPKCITRRVQVPCETSAAPICADGCPRI